MLHRIFHKDGDDFDLKVSDPKSPSYLLIANDPEMESIIKYYEGWHDIRKNYPYIGWGHCIQPHERKRFTRNLTVRQADSLLRADLTSFCSLFLT